MSKDLQEVAIDLSEVALDSLTDDQLVKDIPVIGTFVRLARATMSIPDRIFAKKVERFIVVVNSISREKRNRFHARLDADPDLRRKAGEVVVLTLDRAEDLHKAAIIGKVFSHFVIGDIPFDRIGKAVGEARIDDLDGGMNGRDCSQNFIDIIRLVARSKICCHRKGDLRLGDAPV